jgi:acyl carrier protein
MTSRSVPDRLKAILREVAGPGRTPPALGAETPLRAGGFWFDSVALLELIVAVETEFGVDFDPATDFGDAALRTVGSLTAVIERRLAVGPA